MIKGNHLEVSEGPTKIVASADCPLEENEVAKNQVFNNHIVCICEGQGQDFICPSFYGAIYPNKMGELYIDCRR